MTITQNAVAGSSLDTYLYVYDSQGREIARNDDSNGSLNSRVQVQVTAGATYFVQADAFSTSSGQYSLSFSTASDGRLALPHILTTGLTPDAVDMVMAGFGLNGRGH